MATQPVNVLNSPEQKHFNYKIFRCQILFNACYTKVKTGVRARLDVAFKISLSHLSHALPGSKEKGQSQSFPGVHIWLVLGLSQVS